MEIFFYFFASSILMSSLFVVLSKNPIYSILWLILAFLNLSGLLILLKAEFLAMMFIVIYVGAIAVLFLFIIMMLDLNSIFLKSTFKENLFFNILICLFIFSDLVAVILLAKKGLFLNREIDFNYSNTQDIGNILYTKFFLSFQIVGIILFVGVIGCVSLTIRYSKIKNKRNIVFKNQRNKQNSILLVEGKFFKGVEGINYE